MKIPSDNLFKVVLQLEKDFHNYHGKDLAKSLYVFKKLYDIILPKVKEYGIPDEVLYCLIRTRTYIRLNNLNKTLISKQFKISDKIKKIKFTK